MNSTRGIIFVAGAVLTSAAAGVLWTWPAGVLVFGALLLVNAYRPPKEA